MRMTWNDIKKSVKKYAYVYDDIDTKDAERRIKDGIWFRGPTIWILAFSIIIASVGLNVNSTAVIIGAMLISPLMGPIIGLGLGMGINDIEFLKAAAKNLLIMVVISLLASTLFFLLSPLSLANPTELEARTAPTIYDVLIAFFGGLAGILENSRKERGTVLSGVAIATALMPPLCTAGYGLAHLNFHYFFGALYLFVINSVFIALATFLMVKYLRFETVGGLSPEALKRRKQAISTILVIVIVPSIWSAALLIRNNNYEVNAREFVENNRLIGPHSYVYDYKIKAHHTEISIAGEPLSDSLRTAYFTAAARHKIKEKTITIQEHTVHMSQEDMDRMIDEVYTKTSEELAEEGAMIASLQARMDELAREMEILRHQQDTTGTADTAEMTQTL